MSELLPQDIEVLNKLSSDGIWEHCYENQYEKAKIERAVVLARQETEKRKHNVCQLCENKKEEGTICLSCFRVCCGRGKVSLEWLKKKAIEIEKDISRALLQKPPKYMKATYKGQIQGTEELFQAAKKETEKE